MHHANPVLGSKVVYFCFGKGCRSGEQKIWRRLDNFKDHVKRKHKNESMAKLLEEYA